jgi:hypothetical protein
MSAVLGVLGLVCKTTGQTMKKNVHNGVVFKMFKMLFCLSMFKIILLQVEPHFVKQEVQKCSQHPRSP